MKSRAWTSCSAHRRAIITKLHYAIHTLPAAPQSLFAVSSAQLLTFLGNIAKDDPTNYPKPEDLVTPTLKSNTYTTGRGGTGNMARNDPEHPELARAAQDVDSKVHPEPQGPKHYGRGGAANIIGDGQPAQRQSAEAKRKSDEVKREDNGKGLLGKGKDLLNKLGKK